MLDIHLQNEDQRVINAIYDHFQSTSKWPGIRTLRKELGRTVVDSVAKRNKPSLVEMFKDNMVEYYKLTFHGFLVCPKASDDIRTLLRFLELLKSKFEKNPEIREITSKEIEQALELSKDQSRRLSALVQLGNLWGGGASFGSDAWRVGVVSDIEDLIDSKTVEDYLRNRLKKEEQRQREIEKRYSKLDKFPLLFWISFNINLWLGSYIAFLFSRKSLPIAIFIILWCALYSISKVGEGVFKKRVPFFSSEKVLEKLIWWIITIGISFAAGIILKTLL
jgi:sulfur relay (sulfurtransferase) DsrC/TusE family protein